jgi:hypothetical protein
MPDLPEWFEETFNISLRWNFEHTLRMLPVIVWWEMDYKKMKTLLNVINKNSNIFKSTESRNFLDYRIWIIDELRNPVIIEQKF